MFALNRTINNLNTTLLKNIQRIRCYRAAVIQEFGKAFVIDDIKDRKLASHEILIQTETAGVNYADIMMANGNYYLPKTLPFIPGYEIIGIIDSVGEKIKNWQEGDRVLVIKNKDTGGFAERTLAHEDQDCIVKLPYSIDSDTALMLSSYCSAYLGMKKIVTNSKGNSFFISSAKGTVGFAAMDLAQNVFEGVVFGASDTENKLASIRAANVNSTFNWNDKNLIKQIRDKTFNQGVDFVVDTVGGQLFNEFLKCLKNGGHVLSLGFSSGIAPTINLLEINHINASLSGIWLSGYYKEDIINALDMIIKMFDDGFLQGIKVCKYPIENINKCFQDMQDPSFFGKAIITVV